MKTLRIYSQQLSYVTAMLIALIILYIASLGLIYHITGSLYLLTTFIQSPPTPPLETTNLTSFSMSLFLKFNLPIILC